VEGRWARPEGLEGKKAAGWAFPGLAGWEVCSLFIFISKLFVFVCFKTISN
jgi:hypothetical protein